MRTLPMTRSSCVHSWRCPGVTSAASGTPVPSQTRCTLVPKPPRLRPRAWSTGPPGGRFFFRRPARGAGGADVGAVDAEQLRVDQPRLVQAQLQALDGAVEQPALAHLAEAVVGGLP